MQLGLIGGGSFIANHVRATALERGIDVLLLDYGKDIPSQLGTATIINFAIAPEYQKLPYAADYDYDLRAARAAKQIGANFVMLSTRRVYPPESRLNAKETDIANGDETPYGRNKAITEKTILAEMPGATVLRLSNVFGMEYGLARPRTSFFGRMLRSLKEENLIRFDMHPDTRRDFIPVAAGARAILDAAFGSRGGIYNMGCGFGIRCGDIAGWVMAGYGGGSLIVEKPQIHDEFFLNTGKWIKQFGPLVDKEGLADYCKTLGRKLRDA